MKFEPILHKFSNGISVLLDPMDLETTNVKVHFRTGARDEKPNEYGLTHFCEHMLCKGTARFPTQKIANEYMDFNGGVKNASTGISGLNLYGRILAENVNILIDFFGDQIQNSLFLPEKIEIERKVISDELRRAQDDPNGQLYYFTKEKLFNNTGYSNVIQGTFDNIANFTRGQMLEFLSRRLSAKNCIIGISGKINDADEVLATLEKTFGFLPATDVSENTDIAYTPAVAHNSQPDKKNVKLRIFFPDIWDMAYENRYKNFCIGKFERFLRDEIYEVVRHENGLAYGFGLDCMGNEKFNLNRLATETSVENLEKCIALISRAACKIYSENKISKEDLGRYSRKNKLGNADFLESAGRRCDKLIDFYRDYGRVYDFFDTIKLSDSVNRDDVIKNSRGYFDGAISIITQGADYKIDLKHIWEENFK
ncbi:MAG: insulinase family protein [Rickettsiales bacterium]|jgi:predicted Zn-dependent peptidase|nr:insulinase family protein [Rickettsiales bacterium]